MATTGLVPGNVIGDVLLHNFLAAKSNGNSSYNSSYQSVKKWRTDVRSCDIVLTSQLTEDFIIKLVLQKPCHSRRR